MNRSYNFRMPPNLAGGQYGMMASPTTAPAPDYNARIDPLTRPAPDYNARVDPLTRPAPASAMASTAPTSETFGSLEISDPYMRELMRQYYVPPTPVPPLSNELLRSRYPIVLPAEQTTQPSSYMRDLMRNYAPTMPSMPSMPANLPPPQQTQANAFFTF